MPIDEDKKEQVPSLHTAWIGAPPDAKTGVPGHDVFGVIQMAKANTTNPIKFWCLGPHVAHYKEAFKEHPNVEVISIQEYLDSFPKGTPMGKRAAKLKMMMDICLTEPRNKTLDKVGMKDAFFLFGSCSWEGPCWWIDTNNRPADPKEKVSMPLLNKFHIPILLPKVPSLDSIKHEDLESWLMFSPGAGDDTAEKLFDEYCKLFLVREKIYQNEGYSKKYHNTSVEPLIVPAYQLVRQGKIGLLPTKVSDDHVYVYLKQFNLMKNYYNTHKFINSSFYDKNTKSKVDDSKIYDEVFKAIQCDDYDKLEDLIARGMNINRQMQTDEAPGETPLHLAIKNENVAAVRLLLKNKADLNLKVNYEEYERDMTPYQLALEIDNRDIIKLVTMQMKKQEKEKNKRIAEAKNDARLFAKAIIKPERIVAKIYQFSVSHKKTHPEDLKLLEQFKQQVRQDHAKIQLDPPEYKAYQENYSEFIAKYDQNVERLFEDFRQSTTQKLRRT